jgi:hypothetical protein
MAASGPGSTEPSEAGAQPSQTNSRQSGNAQYDSDEEADVHSQHRKLVKEIVKEAKIEISNYEGVLLKTGTDGRNLTHVLIFRLKDMRKRASPYMLDFVEELVVRDPQLFTRPDNFGQIPLHVAAASNVGILFRVVDLVIPVQVLEDMKTECTHTSDRCPLVDVNIKRRDQCQKRPDSGSQDNIEQESRSPPDGGTNIGQRRTQDNTRAKNDPASLREACLHSRMDTDKVGEKDEELRRTLTQALGHSTTSQASCLQSLLVVANFYEAEKDVPQKIPLNSFKVLELCPDKIFESSNSAGFNPLQMAVRLYNEQLIDYNHLFTIIQALVNRSPSSIFFKAEYTARDDLGQPTIC